MGMFDIIKVPCPKCGAYYEAQSKAGECVLAEYFFSSAPIRVLADLEGEKMCCEKCGTTFELKVQAIAMPVISQ